MNAAKLVASLPGDAGSGGGGAVLESRRERRERVGGARERRGGGRGFIDAMVPRRSEAAAALAVRFGDTFGDRGLCTIDEVLPVLVLGVSRETTYGPVGEAGISTLLRTE